jgi:hypothetical protein
MKYEPKWRMQNQLKKMFIYLTILTILLFITDISLDVFGNGYGLWGGPTRMFRPPSQQASEIMHKLLAFSAQGGEWPEVNDMAVTIGFKNIEKINSKVCEAWLLETTASSNEQQYIYTDTAPHIRPFLHFEGERYLVVVCSDYGITQHLFCKFLLCLNRQMAIRPQIPRSYPNIFFLSSILR